MKFFGFDVLIWCFFFFFSFLSILVLFFILADSRARLVAGSFQGYKGHVDGKPSEARFNHPKGLTMDDKGNVYVADILNLAVRKIGDTGMHSWH